MPYRKTVIFIIIFSLCLGAFFTYRTFKQHQTKRAAPVALPDKTITLIEGWTEEEINKYIQNRVGINSDLMVQAEKSFNAEQFSFLESKPKDTTLEGFLFPDTYRVSAEPTAQEIVGKLLSNFQIKFGQASSGSEKNQSDRFIIPGYEKIKINGLPGMSIYNLVTLASILERETGRDISAGDSDSRSRLLEERKTVAGIFYNRLMVGQALQSDATVNYATGKSAASPSFNDLEVNSLYNTYKYAGLPPGPIASPSLSSLEAVLNPIKTDYYYFLHKQPSGQVVYAKNFNEHVRNKQLYLK